VRAGQAQPRLADRRRAARWLRVASATRTATPRAQLRQLAASHPDGAALLATDGVFSMDGDLAPLRELAVAARAQQALLYVDDAHGGRRARPEGRGSGGRGAFRPAATTVPLRWSRFGKALGSAGAVVAATPT
jgi:8-amino-7-oxononanoate synthase